MAGGRVQIPQNKACPSDCLVLPGPGRVAATLLLVAGIGLKAGDQQAGVPVGAQGGVNFKQIAFAGFHGQPVDQLAHQCGINLRGLFMGVFINKNQVQVAAIAEFLAPQLAIGNDGDLGRGAVFAFKALPAPAGGHGQHGFGQCAEVVGHLFDGEHAFDVARQRTKNFRVVGPTQQVQAGFVIVFSGPMQGGQPLLQFIRKSTPVKALMQHGIAGELVNHTRMAQQIACWPLRRPQQAQQSLMHGGTLEQQGQVVFAPQQGFYPVDDAQGRSFCDRAFAEPLGSPLNQQCQACAGFIPKRQYFRMLPPQGQTGAKLSWPLL